MQTLSYEWVKTKATMIHYFGLGFIQVKLRPTRRMHFYTDQLPTIMPGEEVHNHRYQFKSHILKGVLYNELFAAVQGDEFVRTQVSCTPDHSLSPDITVELVGLQSLGKFKLTTGCQYLMEHGTFHRVEAKNCVTLLERGDYLKEHAEVIRSTTTKPVCPFSQKIPEETLWNIVEKMLRS